MTTFKWHATTPLTVQGARDFWDARYQHSVTPWDRGDTNPALVKWLDEKSLQPCRILVPGCGRGYEVVELARRSFEVTAVDFSPQAIQSVQSKLNSSGLKAKLVQTDLFTWAPESVFDAIYEQTCLCALLPEQWPAYANLLAKWIRPKGQLFALFMQTGKESGPPFHCDIEVMRRLFTDDYWHWPDTEPVEAPHSPGFFELGVVLERK